MATLLSMCRDAADLIGIQRPIGIMAGGDQTARTLLACATREGRALSRRWTWQAMTVIQTFTSVAAEARKYAGLVVAVHVSLSVKPVVALQTVPSVVQPACDVHCVATSPLK